MQFITTNLNPSGKLVGDCVVRAIMKATGQSWVETYNALCKIGEKNYQMPNSKSTYEEYLTSLGWKKQRMPRFPDKTRYTVRQFADANPKGKYIINVTKHMTVVIDGTLYDTWTCGRNKVGNYWTE